eukprot:Rhum_TRINITY_DN18755_c0_g1::Rhum_TRINITY_DN18755_c0_g1_i1::g.168343::m.168343
MSKFHPHHTHSFPPSPSPLFLSNVVALQTSAFDERRVAVQLFSFSFASVCTRKKFVTFLLVLSKRLCSQCDATRGRVVFFFVFFFCFIWLEIFVIFCNIYVLRPLLPPFFFLFCSCVSSLEPSTVLHKVSSLREVLLQGLVLPDPRVGGMVGNKLLDLRPDVSMRLDLLQSGQVVDDGVRVAVADRKGLLERVERLLVGAGGHLGEADSVEQELRGAVHVGELAEQLQGVAAELDVTGPEQRHGRVVVDLVHHLQLLLSQVAAVDPQQDVHHQRVNVQTQHVQLTEKRLIRSSALCLLLQRHRPRLQPLVRRLEVGRVYRNGRAGGRH